MTPEEAIAFGQKHVAVWNRHDLDEIMDMYSDDVELTSPLAVQIAGVATLSGRPALRDYFSAGLEKYPELRFDLLDVLHGEESVTLYFRSIGGRMVAEVLFVRDGLVQKVFAHYSASAA
ncbi:MAG TPA: nuclear transport factor 2 family protein [Egibacteraceae bacterium]|nr:nuclear transport factor 2 family protein [Egibacteraceae bacterium]